MSVDDILLYAKSLEELSVMLEILSEELVAIGLLMHEMTKILAFSNPSAYY